VKFTVTTPPYTDASGLSDVIVVTVGPAVISNVTSAAVLAEWFGPPGYEAFAVAVPALVLLPYTTGTVVFRFAPVTVAVHGVWAAALKTMLAGHVSTVVVAAFVIEKFSLSLDA